MSWGIHLLHFPFDTCRWRSSWCDCIYWNDSWVLKCEKWQQFFKEKKTLQNTDERKQCEYRLCRHNFYFPILTLTEHSHLENCTYSRHTKKAKFCVYVFDRILHANNGLFHSLLVCTSLEKLSCTTHEYSDFWYIPKYGFCKWSQVQSFAWAITLLRLETVHI